MAIRLGCRSALLAAPCEPETGPPEGQQALPLAGSGTTTSKLKVWTKLTGSPLPVVPMSSPRSRLPPTVSARSPKASRLPQENALKTEEIGPNAEEAKTLEPPFRGS